MKKRYTIEVPGGADKVLLHTCCAPCSSAIIECLMSHGITPVIYYCNPNIYPEEEYRIRKDECTRYASEHGFSVITTTLASSRWKSLEQINEAGRYAAGRYPGVTFWEQNWRKGGLSERRIAIIKEYGFYNQQYCGCEFSKAPSQQEGKASPPYPSTRERE